MIAVKAKAAKKIEKYSKISKAVQFAIKKVQTFHMEMSNNRKYFSATWATFN